MFAKDVRSISGTERLEIKQKTVWLYFRYNEKVECFPGFGNSPFLWKLHFKTSRRLKGQDSGTYSQGDLWQLPPNEPNPCASLSKDEVIFSRTNGFDNFAGFVD